jgi:hypothetical protein
MNEQSGELIVKPLPGHQQPFSGNAAQDPAAYQQEYQQSWCHYEAPELSIPASYERSWQAHLLRKVHSQG